MRESAICSVLTAMMRSMMSFTEKKVQLLAFAFFSALKAKTLEKMKVAK